MNIKRINNEFPCIAWWSGGVTSAIVCKLCIDWFGKDNVRVIFIDTKNEDDDTYRFKQDCEKWYGVSIETMTNENYESIRDVWFKYKGLNISVGATCSLHLKMKVREKFQRENKFSCQAFGFDIDEPKRAKSFTLSYRKINPIYPLLVLGYSKKDCIEILNEGGILIPRSYRLGLNNNNCLKTGCVQGGIGYWQKIKRDFPDKFEQMAKVEHELTDLKGEPVTMLKDQSKNGGLVFLKPHPNYPNIKDLSMMKGREPKPLFECNGFCGTNDLQLNETMKEINYEQHADTASSGEEAQAKNKIQSDAA